MGSSRYLTTNILQNFSVEYAEMLQKRGISSITHYSFNRFREIKARDIPNVRVSNHIWASGDRFYKLADTYYGDPTYWWIIAYWNYTPLETDVKLGQTVKIPTPLETILSALAVEIR